MFDSPMRSRFRGSRAGRDVHPDAARYSLGDRAGCDGRFTGRNDPAAMAVEPGNERACMFEAPTRIEHSHRAKAHARQSRKGRACP
jgi:hypothetical protein